MESNTAMHTSPANDRAEAQGRQLAVVLILAATVAFTYAFLSTLGEGGPDLGALGLAFLCAALLIERVTARPR